MAGIIFQYPCRDGTTGLELEAVRHHYSRVTPSYGCNLVNAVLQAREEVAACAPRETHAAIKIQATFRMHRQATAFRNQRCKACAIQRVFRGYSTRQRLQHERATTQRLAYLQTVFDMFATRIQACYRGYHSRKTRSNYYAQQSYINTVMARSLRVLEDAHRTRIEQDTLRCAESQRVQALYYARRTAQMHHTVSTCSIQSVYLRPPTSLDRMTQKLLSTIESRREGGGEEEDMVGAAVLDDYELAQVALFTAGERLEDDIRQNSRAARHEGGDTLVKPCVLSESSPRPEGSKAASQTQTTEKKRVCTTAFQQTPHLPAVDATSRRHRSCIKASSSRTAEESGPKTYLTVPWEEASATAPQRPLIEKAHQHRPNPFYNTAPASSTSATAALKSATIASATSHNAVRSVSSFHRTFGVRPHDCVEFNLSFQTVATQNGAVEVTFPGPLSMAKELAALEHSVDQKLIKSLHGNAIFKVPAARGKRA